jgi:hypothetical protein
MSSSKKIDLSRDFAAGVYLSEAQNPIPPPQTLYTVYQVLIHTGKGGGELNQREATVPNRGSLGGATVPKAGSKNTKHD